MHFLPPVTQSLWACHCVRRHSGWWWGHRCHLLPSGHQDLLCTSWPRLLECKEAKLHHCRLYFHQIVHQRSTLNFFRTWLFLLLNDSQKWLIYIKWKTFHWSKHTNHLKLTFHISTYSVILSASLPVWWLQVWFVWAGLRVLVWLVAQRPPCEQSNLLV